MFGHDDSSNQNNTTVTPTEEPQLTALPPTPLAPTSADATDATPGFIPTDAKGQPDEAVSAPALAGPASDLLEIKQAALQQLSPLVGHLNQSPEEKFRTTMMMIQASDDQSLINQAYEAAKQISDEKTRAQALLDIINEINYFTQQHEA
jgi:hypothetical protein